MVTPIYVLPAVCYRNGFGREGGRCVACPIGTYNTWRLFSDTCVTCPEGSTTTEPEGRECSMYQTDSQYIVSCAREK